MLMQQTTITVHTLSLMDKIGKLKQRLDNAFLSKQFYEAHQIMRTMHSRMLEEGRNAELLDLLHSGCLILCEGREFSSAVDLAELYVGALKRGGHTLNTETCDRILELFSHLPGKFDSDNPGSHSDRRAPFLNKTLDWALKSAEGRPELLRGCAFLHQKFAAGYENEGRQDMAERYARAADWLLGEADRLEQTVATANEATDEEGLDKMESEEGPKRETSEIDLD